MPRRRRTSKDEIHPALILIIALAICICGFLYSLSVSELLGALVFGLFCFAIVFALILYMEKETGVQIIRPIIRKLFGKKPRIPTEKEHTYETPSLSTFDEVTDILKNWYPSKFRDESYAQVGAVEYLKHYFPRLRDQQPHGELVADLEIENIGIEIKVPKKSRQLTTLRGQVMQYCKYFEYVIVLIFDYYQIPRLALKSFEDDIRDYYGNKVRVIIK